MKRNLLFAFIIVICVFALSSVMSAPASNAYAAKLSSEKIRQAKSKIEAYLCAQWTEQRIKRFCLPTTRYLVGQQLVPMSTNFINGHLYSDLTHELGAVTWRGSLDENGEPLDFELSVSRPGQHEFWILEGWSVLGKSNLLPQDRFTNNEFDKYILNRILSNAVVAYIHAHFWEKPIPEDFKAVTGAKVIEIARDETGRPLRFIALLTNDQVLTGNLSPDMAMGDILLDGLPNRYWTAINDELIQNMEKTYNGPH